MLINRTHFFQANQSNYQKSSQNHSRVGQGSFYATQKENDRQDALSRKRMLSQGRLEDQRNQTMNAPKVFQSVSNSKVLDENISYAESLRIGRTKAKDTSLKLKQLRYNFKSISTQILRSKTSASARQVASKARREVIRLKRLRQNGEYDDEELQSAITHAQAMERVAKKKARHLQEEEMAKTGGPCEGDLEEKEVEKKPEDENWEEWEKSPKEEQDPEEMELPRELMQDQMAQYREMMEAMAEELQAMASARMESAMGDMMSDMMEDMWESMRDMMEDMGLDDLEDGMLGGVSREMDPADLKMMKIRHRTKEMKAIAEADSEYLKAVFDKLQRERGGSVPSVAMGGGGAPISVDSGSSIAAAFEAAGMTMPAAESVSVGIDISV